MKILISVIIVFIVIIVIIESNSDAITAAPDVYNIKNIINATVNVTVHVVASICHTIIAGQCAQKNIDA